MMKKKKYEYESWFRDINVESNLYDLGYTMYFLLFYSLHYIYFLGL